MRAESPSASRESRQWTLRSVPWLDGCFIGAIVALSAYDIVRSYHATVLGTGRELDTQARVIAEQTARGLQAVDVVLRHLVEQHQRGALSALSREDMRAYLREQAVGLVQIDGLAIANADGSLRASSYIDPAQEPTVNISGNDAIEALRPGRYPGLFVGNTRKSAVDGQWFFPMARRLESTSGEFLGLVVARGRIDYFQQFYRDIRLDQGTKTTLMHQTGTLLARHPPAESALGKHFALFDELLALRAAQQPGPSRTVSPVDRGGEIRRARTRTGLPAGRHRNARDERGTRTLARTRRRHRIAHARAECPGSVAAGDRLTPTDAPL